MESSTCFTDTPDTPDTSHSLPQVTLLIENPKKSCNWGPLLRCCSAFGIAQIFVVGYGQCSVKGAHGADKHVELLSFPTHQQARSKLKEYNYELMGVLHGVADAYNSDGYTVVKEWDESLSQWTEQVTTHKKTYESHQTDRPLSFPVQERRFAQNTCLVVGRKTRGLVCSLSDICDSFVHIPQMSYGQASANWLNVEAGVSIVLHEFASWAGYGRATQYQGQKYHVKLATKGSAPNNRNEQRKQRDLKRKMEEAEEEGHSGNFWSDDIVVDGDY